MKFLLCTRGEGFPMTMHHSLLIWLEKDRPWSTRIPKYIYQHVRMVCCSLNYCAQLEFWHKILIWLLILLVYERGCNPLIPAYIVFNLFISFVDKQIKETLVSGQGRCALWWREAPNRGAPQPILSAQNLVKLVIVVVFFFFFFNLMKCTVA